MSDNSEWEKQLLRLRNDSTITFNFGSMISVTISGIEIVFYNCPSRNTGADAFSIRINGQSHIAAVGTANGVSSCDHLKNLFLQLLNFSIIPNKKKTQC